MKKNSEQYIISPSILSADFTRLGEDLKAIELYGADWVHIDVMDGHFVPNLTMGPVVVEACKRITSLPLDVHLMVEKPEQLIEAFAAAGADILTIHAEASPNLHRTLQKITLLGCKAGVAINPGTSEEAVKSVLGLVDLILVMTVNPGYSGQSFIPETLPKIKKISTWLQEAEFSCHLQVDGGVSEETIGIVRDAGANTFVAGNGIFKHPQGIEKGISALRNHLYNS